ncbi:hypothetical protein [Pengzhenrongella frigida]|uniref:Uncharacterized protein n=1 Tax=Pengzhenrongella frigida TaxID=1259133 RepID=A0A4V1ZH49_9MICO|nr:hypothetical protein [Cellulomonas sp. HLT2-17]RYV50804.1 hypothetical protein EUA98_11680 [Cellulomonas sp. HLT2-17]
MVTLDERPPDRGRAATLQLARPAPTIEAPAPGRARRFAELEALIRAKESDRIRLAWDVPEADRRQRLQALERSARRQGQLAESARLAVERRTRR